MLSHRYARISFIRVKSRHRTAVFEYFRRDNARIRRADLDRGGGIHRDDAVQVRDSSKFQVPGSKFQVPNVPTWNLELGTAGERHKPFRIRQRAFRFIPRNIFLDAVRIKQVEPNTLIRRSPVFGGPGNLARRVFRRSPKH